MFASAAFDPAETFLRAVSNEMARIQTVATEFLFIHEALPFL